MSLGQATMAEISGPAKVLRALRAFSCLDTMVRVTAIGPRPAAASLSIPQGNDLPPNRCAVRAGEKLAELLDNEAPCIRSLLNYSGSAAASSTLQRSDPGSDTFSIAQRQERSPLRRDLDPNLVHPLLRGRPLFPEAWH